VFLTKSLEERSMIFLILVIASVLTLIGSGLDLFSENSYPVDSAGFVIGPNGQTVVVGCLDSDSRNYFVNGSVIYSTDANNYCVYPDICQGTRVKEYYCYNNTVRYLYYNCTSGCLNGKCNPVPTRLCTPNTLKSGTQCLVCNSAGSAYVMTQSKCTITGQTCNSSGRCVNVSTKKFIILEELFYQNQPDLAQYGLKPDWVIYESWVGSPPTESQVRARAREAKGKSYNGIVQLDIEMWETDSRQFSNVDVAVSNLVQIAKWFKNESPELKLGYYSMVPITDVWDSTSGDNVKINAWKAANNKLQPIADTVDILCPGSYTYYPDMLNQWIQFSRAMIAESKRIGKGKPVYPYISPQYHPSSDAAGQEVSYEYFKTELETIYNAGADGVVIWGGNNGMGYPATWNPNAGWWRATREFIQEHNLG
jgi:hypothetical protein